MNYFALNTHALFSKFPALEQALNSYSPAPKLEIISTPSGNPSAMYNGISVHSRRDPRKEARSIIASEIPENTSIAVFYGFGLGYLVESFIELFPNKPCLVIEPDVSCFLASLSFRDLCPILNHPRAVFFLASEPAQIVQYLETQDLAHVQIVKLRSLFQKDKTYYDRTEALIQSFLRQQQVNTNTLKRFGKLWVRNLVANMKLIAQAPGINSLAGAFAGVPALILAGGPSLDEVLPSLRSLCTRMLFIAVDTTLAALQRAGIDPDFTVIADPQYWNTRHLDGALQTDSIIVSESSTHPRIFRLLGNRVLLFSSIFPLGRLLESIVGEKGKLGAGGSVATTAWDWARFLGCSPIVMSGLDLSFPGKRTHFRGAFFEESFHRTGIRFKPQETSSFAYLHDAGPFLTRANDGGLVLTDQRMAVYSFWFETQMRLHPETVTRTLSLPGVKIENMNLIERETLLSFPETRALIDKKKEALQILFIDKASSSRLVTALKDGLADILADLAALEQTASLGRRATEDLAKRIRHRENTATALNKLDAIDIKIGALSSKHIAGFLAGPLIKAICDSGPQGKKPEETLETSRQLYGELENSARYHLALLKRGLALL